MPRAPSELGANLESATLLAVGALGGYLIGRGWLKAGFLHETEVVPLLVFPLVRSLLKNRKWKRAVQDAATDTEPT